MLFTRHVCFTQLEFALPSGDQTKNPPTMKAHSSIRPTITLVLIAIKTSPIGGGVCYILLEPKPPSGGGAEKNRAARLFCSRATRANPLPTPLFDKLT